MCAVFVVYVFVVYVLCVSVVRCVCVLARARSWVCMLCIVQKTVLMCACACMRVASANACNTIQLVYTRT